MKIPRQYAIALTAAFGLFMAVLDNTIVNVALTPMARDLNTNLNAIQWVVTGYFLAQAAVIPPAGYFSNRFGIKRMYMICLVFFTVGSLLCGLATSVEMLIFFRVLQGIGGGALFPLAQAIAFGAFPPEKRAASGAVIGIPVIFAPIFGPTVGGLLTDTLGWEYIFFINVPVGLVVLFFAWRIIPADTFENVRKVKFDMFGLVLSIVGVVLVVYAFTLVSEPIPGTQTALNPRGELNGWGYWLVWVVLGAGLLVTAGFGYYATRISKDPVLDLRLFKEFPFLMGSIVSWFTAVVVFGSIFLLPVFLEQVRTPHLSALDAGLALMPQGLAAAVAIIFGGRLYNRLGVRTLVVTGSVLLVISSFALTNLQPNTDSWWLMPWLLMRGLGFGLAAIPVQTLALQVIVGPALPKATSLFNTTRQVASSIGIAVLSTLFAQQTAYHATQMAASAPQVPAGVDPNSPAVLAAREQFMARAGTAAMNDIFWYVTIGCIVLLFISFLLPSKAKPRVSESGAPAEKQPMVMAE